MAKNNSRLHPPQPPELSGRQDLASADSFHNLLHHSPSLVHRMTELHAASKTGAVLVIFAKLDEICLHIKAADFRFKRLPNGNENTGLNGIPYETYLFLP
jgi:hypothetical protein